MEDFGEVVGSIAKSKEIKDIRFKFKNDPIRLGEISAKSKQSEIVEEVTKISAMLVQVRRGKEKQLIVSSSLEQDEDEEVQGVKFLGKCVPSYNGVTTDEEVVEGKRCFCINSSIANIKFALERNYANYSYKIQI
ncbi:hypothetical protein KY284_003337 [Solanum tuberosum]|nr:hypothetical protein KY284_003337 [Solanum tuberosum]